MISFLPLSGSGCVVPPSKRSNFIATINDGPPSSRVYLGTTPHPVTVTTRIPFLVGKPKPLFVAVIGWGVDCRYT